MRFIHRLALAALAVALFAPAAFASQARIDALGLQSDFIQDYVNVIHYPSTIVRYNNLVYGDLGIKNTDGGSLGEFEDNDAVPPGLEQSARGLGAHLKLWQKMPGVLGIQLNENATPISPSYGAEYWNRNRNEGVSLLWGNDFGGITAGFQFNHTNSSIEDTDGSASPAGPGFGGGLPLGSTSRSAMNAFNAGLGARPWNTTGFGGGISFDWNGRGRNHTADVAVQYRLMDYEIEDLTGVAPVVEESDGSFGLAVNARAQYAISDNSYLVPVFNYWTMDVSNKLTDGVAPGNDFEAENTVSGWSFGLAESWVLRTDDLVTLGLQFGQEEVEYGDVRPLGGPFEATYTTTPMLFGSAEVNATNWMKVRVGASKAFSSQLEYSNTGTGDDIELTDAPFGYAVGMGFRIGGRLDLDAVVNQDFAFTGSWGASGNEETPFSRLSATYRW